MRDVGVVLIILGLLLAVIGAFSYVDILDSADEASNPHYVQVELTKAQMSKDLGLVFVIAGIGFILYDRQKTLLEVVNVEDQPPGGG